MLSDERLAEIKARAEVATDGPWYAHPIHDHPELGCLDGPDEQWVQWTQERGGTELLMGDAQFIAHAREDIPDLVAALEEANFVIRALNSELERKAREEMARV